MHMHGGFSDVLKQNAAQRTKILQNSKNCLARMQGFDESRRPVRGVAQPGRAPALGAGSRQFESGRPDHYIVVNFPCLAAKKSATSPRLTGDCEAIQIGFSSAVERMAVNH